MGPVFLQQLDHNAMCGLGMNEGYETVDAPAGGLVDQADAAGAQVFEGLGYIGHGETDMVCSFASPRQEAGGTALIIGRRQEFKCAVAGVEEGDFDAVGRCIEPLQEPEAEDAAVGCEGIVDVLDYDADVIDLGVG